MLSSILHIGDSDVSLVLKTVAVKKALWVTAVGSNHKHLNVRKPKFPYRLVLTVSSFKNCFLYVLMSCKVEMLLACSLL